jgi:serine/threonine protein kinase
MGESPRFGEAETIGSYTVVNHIQSEESSNLCRASLIAHPSAGVFDMKVYKTEHFAIEEYNDLFAHIRIVSTLNFQMFQNYYDCFAVDNPIRIGVCFEPVEGQTIKQTVHTLRSHNKRLQEVELWSFLVQTTIALNELNKYNIVHCNLNQDNVVIKHNMEIRFINFESAVALEGVQSVRVLKNSRRSQSMK